MSDTDSRWPTTTPETRLTSGPEKVSVRDALGPGTRLLEEFEVLRVLGTGGFGIVYLARDHVLQRDIAIKEYMPAALAWRGEGATVALRASTGAETFAKGLESFLGEARLLASFDHPALVKVHRFWRSNATAYMAMPYYPGRTLKDVRLEMPAAPGEAWLRGLIEPVLGALEQLHAHGVCHRDIAPDNILVLPDGRPVLLDFGCARRAIAGAGGSQWFTAHLKPQFAPLEQYADEGSVGQGPWTDLYSLGATLHFVVTGRAPPASVARAARDTLPALSSLPLPGISSGLLGTIDWTLALAPADRPQDVETVRRALRGEIAPPPPRRLPIGAGDPGAAAALAAPEGTAPKREALQGEAVPVAAGRADRGAHWGAALSIAFAALAALAALAGPGGGPSTLPEPSLAATPPSVGPAATERLAVPERLADAISPIVVVPAVSGASRGEAAEPSAASLRSISAPAPVAVAREPDKPARSAKARPAKRPLPTATAVSVGQGACSGDRAGLLTSTLCVLNPCRDPNGRTRAECLDRRRAEEARLRRVASLG
jgi:hypothetical protein